MSLFTRHINSKDLEVIKEQNASLQIHVLHLQEEINESQGKIRKVRDVSSINYMVEEADGNTCLQMIKLYSQLLQEMAARFSIGSRRSEEPGYLLTRAPRTKEEEHDLLKVKVRKMIFWTILYSNVVLPSAETNS